MRYIHINTYLAITIFSFLFFAGCSGGSGGGGQNPTAGNSVQNAEEALKKLSPQHKANFDAWQTKVIKACDSSDAFGLQKNNKVEDYGLDGAALIKKNNGSIVFSDGKNLAILTRYNAFSGTGNTKAEETTDLNGQAYTVSVETKREGSNCSVYLYGQKVYETGIVQSFTIGTQYSLGKEATATSQIPIVRGLGVGGATEIVQHGIYSLLSLSLRPSKESQNFIGQNFGLNAEQSAKLFKLSDYPSTTSAVKIDGDTSAVWSNSETGNLISQESTLKKAFDGTSRELSFEVRLQVPQFDFRGTKNTSDNGSLRLILTSTIIKKDSSFLYTLKGIHNGGLVTFSSTEAENCTKDRFAAYLGSSNGINSISPSTQVMFSPCRTIFPEIENVSYKNGLLKSLIPIVFANVTPSGQFQYGGWDYVLSQFAKENVNQNKDLISELDPSSKTKIVGIVSRHLESIRSEIDKSKNMQQSKDVALQMGLDWSFKGVIISASRISQIIQSVDNSSDIFKVSSERLLSDLARSPNSSDDQLSFALSIDASFKNEATKALNLSKDLSYGVFENDIFNQVIQKKVSIDELKSWSDRFSTIKIEVNKYPALSSVKDDLVGSSLKWLKNGEISAQGLSALYSALNSSVDPFADSTRQLVSDLGQSLSGNKDALEFARNMTAEYKQLALAIRNSSTVAEYEGWGKSFFSTVLQKRPAIDQLRQWNDMWASALAFIQREKTRVVGEIGSMPEWNRKKIIEIAVKETWSGQDFAALEAIAPIAKSKNTCDRYKDASSQADCAGMSLFSKGSKKFFDPVYTGRYANLGSDFKGYMNQMSGFDWTTLKWTLVSEFFGSWEPIWSSCDNSLFNQKASILKSQINAILNETDQFKKWDLERNIKETIKNCN